MQELVELYIANNVNDLEHLAQPEKLVKGRNPQILDKSINNLYKQIGRVSSDQEICFILCLRFLYAIEWLCKIGDRKFVTIKYSSEISRIQDKVKELRFGLEHRYEEECLRKKKENKVALLPPAKPISVEIKKQPCFSGEFISVKQLYKAIHDNVRILIVDSRPANEYLQSKIKFENLINVPEEIIVPGLSANIVGTKLMADTLKIWDKRDSFEAIVFLDWNSSSDNATCTKLNLLKASIMDWDMNRNYKQDPVILNGGFKEFLDSYPSSVTNVHVNFIRHNEDIDELLELENISYPEENISIMPLKQFTIQELEESTKVEESDEEIAEDQDASNISQPVDNKHQEENLDIIGPKGGGAVVDKAAIHQNKDLPTNKIIFDQKKDEFDVDIRNKIEEQRLKLLNEARNTKNKTVGHGDETIVKGSEKKEPNAKIPPPIRRETKPKKSVIPFDGWCGLVNIKNTCYMNTVLQCLKCIPIVRVVLHSNFGQYVTRRPPLVIHEFANVIKVLSEGTEYDKKVYKPSNFYDVVCKLDPVYKKGNHEDCMEFFLFLFNHLNDDCAYDIKKKSIMIEREKSWYSQLQGRTSVWVDLFYHQFQCTKICEVCNLKAVSYETDNTLMLSVPYRPSLRMVHLKELIHEYMEDNQILDYKCSRCHNMRVINRKSVIVEPEILVIVLKRYYQDEYQETRKNYVCVNFDLSFKFGNCYYKLYSIAQHKGTMEHGHYYGHGLLTNNAWVEFNDERTTRFEKDWDSIRGSACAFFYCKDNRTVSKM